MPLPTLPTLPSLSSNIAPVGGGSPIGFPTGGPSTTIGIGVPNGGVPTATPVGLPGSLGGLSAGLGLLNLFTGGAGTSILTRLAMLIIGLICIIGAIYLYKPTQELVAAPARAARDAAMSAGEA